jgi:uncharacterized membrane protein
MDDEIKVRGREYIRIERVLSAITWFLYLAVLVGGYFNLLWYWIIGFFSLATVFLMALCFANRLERELLMKKIEQEQRELKQRRLAAKTISKD